MGHKSHWTGQLRRVTRHYTQPEQTVVEIELDEGVPARYAGRTVSVYPTPELALDWAAEMASRARLARRLNGGYVAPRGENLYQYVARLLRDFAEDTGAQNDGKDTQILDLMTELLKIAGREGFDTEWLADKARELAAEEE